MQTPQRNTLFGVIQHVSSSPKTDAEVVATVVDLINSGRIRPCGALAGTRLVARPSLGTFLDWVRLPASSAARPGSPLLSSLPAWSAITALERRRNLP